MKTAKTLQNFITNSFSLHHIIFNKNDLKECIEVYNFIINNSNNNGHGFYPLKDYILQYNFHCETFLESGQISFELSRFTKHFLDCHFHKIWCVGGIIWDLCLSYFRTVAAEKSIEIQYKLCSYKDLAIIEGFNSFKETNFYKTIVNKDVETLLNILSN